MSLNKIYEKTNYTSDIRYIKDTNIIEYDIKSAGMNILYEMGFINDVTMKELINTPKYERNVRIGKMLRNNREMNIALNNGFKIARKSFIEFNNISENDILSIKKDAIYVINKTCTNLEISENVHFVKANEYDTYIKIMNREHYINLYNNIIDVKGYTSGVKDHHRDYFFRFLIECLWEDKKKDKTDLYKKLLIFKNDLINYNLPVQYYKDLIDDSYIFNLITNNYAIQEIDEESIEDKTLLSFKTELSFLLDMINILL